MVVEPEGWGPGSGSGVGVGAGVGSFGGGLGARCVRTAAMAVCRASSGEEPAVIAAQYASFAILLWLRCLERRARLYVAPKGLLGRQEVAGVGWWEGVREGR